MDTTDLIIFDEVYEPQQPTIYSLEQELFETKRKLSLLEERMVRLEEKLGNLELEEKFDKIELEEKMNKLEEQKSQSFSVIPIPLFTCDVNVNVSEFATFDDFNSNSNLCKFNKFNFCDINCSSIKMDLYYLYIDNLKIFNLNELKYDEFIIKFFKQFKNILILELDFIIPLNYHSDHSKCPFRIELINLFINDNTNIILKRNTLYSKCCGGNDYLIFQEFMKSTNYKKLHIEIKNNLNINPKTGSGCYVSQPYVNETKEYCLRNNIEFTSNIGL